MPAIVKRTVGFLGFMSADTKLTATIGCVVNLGIVKSRSFLNLLFNQIKCVHFMYS